MRKKTGLIVLLLALTFPAKSNLFPDSLLRKPFAVQTQYLDTFYRKLEHLDSSKLTHALLDFEEWAENKKDRQLQYLTRILRYRIFIYRGRGDSIVENELHEMINSQEKNKYVKTEAMQTLALFYWGVKKDFAAALELYLHAHKLYSRFTVEEFPHKPEFQWHLGTCYYHFKDFKLAKDYFVEIIRTIPPNLMDNPVSKTNTLGICYRKLDMFDSSFHYFSRAMDLAKQRNAEDWIGILNGNIADNLFRLGKLDESIPMFEKDLELSMKGKDTLSVALTLAALSDVYRLKKDLPRCMNYTSRFLELIWSHKNPLNPMYEGILYTSAAKAYELAGDRVKAYAFLDTAMNAIHADHKQSNLILLSGVQHRVDVQSHMLDLKTKEGQLNQQKQLRNSFIIGFLIVLFFVIVTIRQKKKLSIEKKRSDSLLLNILPGETAEELKQTGKAAAKSYEEVTILFTDFKNFTRISEEMSAEELVSEINHYFSHFDKIMEKHNVEKIKTIGDGYMCAGGLPVPSETHAKDVVAAAIDIIRFTEEEKKRRPGASTLELRIGIHTGPVVAGIVGINKFAYDIWGDAVNTASRMESSGEPGKINISETTYEKVKDIFPCEYRGEVAAKNKGMMKMYFVNWREQEKDTSSKIQIS